MIRKLWLLLALGLLVARPVLADNCAITVNAGAQNEACEPGGEDSNKFFLSGLGLGTFTGSAWTSATGSNATQVILNDGSTQSFGSPAVQVTLVQTTTITGGVVTFEAAYDGVPDWVSVNLQQISDPTLLTLLGNPYTLQASTNKTFIIHPAGARRLRIRLSTVITGTGSVTPYITRLYYDPAPSVLQASGTPWITNTTQVGSTTIDVNTGNASAGTQRVVLATNQPNFTTPLNVSIATAIAAGTNSIGTVQPGNTANTTPWLVSLVPNTANGSTPGHFLTAASNNSTSIKGSAGTLYHLSVIQTTTTLGDVRLYDSASAPTCSSATGLVTNWALQSSAIAPGLSFNFGPTGMFFANGIGICVTGAVADNDNTSFVTGDQVNYTFK